MKNFSLSGRGGRNSAKGDGLAGETKGIFLLGLVDISLLVSSSFEETTLSCRAINWARTECPVFCLGPSC